MVSGETELDFRKSFTGIFKSRGAGKACRSSYEIFVAFVQF
jgi:hypothetical protein